MRASEIAGLIWDDVSFVDGCIHIRSQLAPLRKGEPPRRVKLKSRASTRTVVLLERATEALLDQLRREQEKGFGHAEDFVFTTGAGTGRPYCRNRISSKGIGQAARKAGLGKAGAQVLRRSAATLRAYARVPKHVAAKEMDARQRKPRVCRTFSNGRCRTRTCGHLRVKQALYQLS